MENIIDSNKAAYDGVIDEEYPYEMFTMTILEDAIPIVEKATGIKLERFLKKKHPLFVQGIVDIAEKKQKEAAQADEREAEVQKLSVDEILQDIGPFIISNDPEGMYKYFIEHVPHTLPVPMNNFLKKMALAIAKILTRSSSFKDHEVYEKRIDVNYPFEAFIMTYHDDPIIKEASGIDEKKYFKEDYCEFSQYVAEKTALLKEVEEKSNGKEN